MFAICSVSSPVLPTHQNDASSLSRQDLAGLLKSCESLSQCNLIHAKAIASGLHNETYIGNLLLTMYREFGSIENARAVFHRMPDRTVVSWTVMMAAYCNQGQGQIALALFHQMGQDGIEPNRVTFLTILNACVDESTLANGKMIHDNILEIGLHSDVVIAAALVNMYGRCGDAHNARIVFDGIEQKDHVLWGTMIAAYVQCGFEREALELFREMQKANVKMTQVTLVVALSACTSPDDLEDGKLIHARISDMGFDTDVVVGTALVNMYGKCGAPQLARAAFDKIGYHDVISWTTMIVAYAMHALGDEAFEIFENMRQKFKANEVTFISILGACTSLDQGICIHGFITEAGLDTNVRVSTALVNMYSRCNSVADAEVVFNKIQQCDIVCWNSMLAMYSQHRQTEKALNVFREMQVCGIEPDQLSFNCVLSACANPAALDDGKWIHEVIKSRGLESDVIVGNALVNMYAKCGAWYDAWAVFQKIEQHNLFSWNAIITGCCQHGRAKDALQLFKDMKQEGIVPDDVTYLCLLNACGHEGLVEEGYDIFLSMISDENQKPRLEHLTCIVSLLGRSGRLDNAEDLIYRTGFEPDPVIWMTLLGACRTHGDVDRAERIAEIIFRLRPDHEAAYILLTNVYAADGRWADVERVEEMMLARGIKVVRSQAPL